MSAGNLQCFICFDELDLSVSDESIRCVGHGFHIECHYRWHKTRNSIGYEVSTCILCKCCLPESIFYELSSFTTMHQKRLLHFAEKDDLRNFVEEFDREPPTSNEFFLRLVIFSLKASTFEVARYLKQYEMKRYNKESKGKFVVQLFLSLGQNINHLLWILGNFSFKAFPFDATAECLSEALICLFDKNGAYLELYWVYTEIFDHLSESQQIRVGSLLFNTAVSGIWAPFEGRIRSCDYVGMFVPIVNRHRQYSSKIKGKIVPVIILDNFDHRPSPSTAGFFMLYCYCDDMWIVIETALKYQNDKFLKDLLLYRFWNHKVSISYYKLAVLIRGTRIYGEARRLLEKYCIFKYPLMWKLTLKYLDYQDKARMMK